MMAPAPGAVRRQHLELAMAQWAAVMGKRDELVRAACAAGITKSRIHRLTGIARGTIDRILKP